MGTGMRVAARKGTANLLARITVPDDLRPAIGRAEIWTSLKTADKREAAKRAVPIFAHWLAEFAALRRTRPATEADLQQAAYDHYVAELEHDRLARTDLPEHKANEAAEKARIKAEIASGVEAHAGHLIDFAGVADPVGQDRRHRAIRRKLIGQHLAEGLTVNVHWAADAVIEAQSLEIVKGSPAYVELCQRLQRAELQALDRAAERDEGDWGGKPTDAAIKAPAASQKALTAKPGESITELFERFARERGGAVRKDTLDQNRMVVGLFAEYVGKSAHISAVNRKAVSGWKQQLMLWPVKAADLKVFAGLDFKGVIAKNAVVGKPAISDKTVNRYLSGVGKFATWLLANDFIDTDVMKGQYLALDKSERKVGPYTPAQLDAIFASPLFIGAKSDNREHLPGTLAIRDWRFWLPLISLFSGARLGEIAQLETADVRKIGDTWIMHVTTEGEGDKRTKTKGSMRVIPLHRALIDLGLLDFYGARAKAKAPRLFPELARDAREQFGDASRFFGRYFLRIGVKVDRTTNFHSLRHNFMDACRNGGFLDEQFGPLVGHTRGTTTGRYGNVPEGTLKARKEIIDAVEYPGLDFGGLLGSESISAM